jgi:hypothetical protein
MSVQSAKYSSLYSSSCPITITNVDNILSYQTAYNIISSKNNGGSPINCFPTNYSLSYVYNTRQLNLCCGNILSKKTAV